MVEWKYVVRYLMDFKWILKLGYWNLNITRTIFADIIVVRVFVDICILWCVCYQTNHVKYALKCVCFVFITAGPLVTSRNRAVCKCTYYRPQYIKYESRPIFFPESRFWLQRCSYITLSTFYGPQTQRYNGILLYKYVNPAASDGLEPYRLQTIRSYWTDHMKNLILHDHWV